jgi:hypothetical protein
MSSGLSIPSNAQYGEHMWTQWYCTQDSADKIAHITYIIGAAASPEKPFTVTIKAGSMPFETLDKAETWLQSRIKGGSKVQIC